MLRCDLPFIIGALLGVGTPVLTAQEAPGTIAIHGVVRDATGRTVTGAWVTAIQESSGQRCMIQTDTLGVFTLHLATPAHYWLSAGVKSQAGTSGFEVSLPDDSVHHFDFTLLPAPPINTGPRH